MRIQLCRTKFRKSCILLAKNWMTCFPGENPVKNLTKRGEKLDRSLAEVGREAQPVHSTSTYNSG